MDYLESAAKVRKIDHTKGKGLKKNSALLGRGRSFLKNVI